MPLDWPLATPLASVFCPMLLFECLEFGQKNRAVASSACFRSYNILSSTYIYTLGFSTATYFVPSSTPDRQDLPGNWTCPISMNFVNFTAIVNGNLDRLARIT